MRFFIVPLLMLVVACGAPEPAPEDHFYRLPAANMPDNGTPIVDVLLVDSYRIDGLFRERNIVYVASADSVELDRYHYHLWHESPGYMLQNHLADYLRRTGLARTVMTSRSGKPDMTISGDLHQFMHIRSGDHGRVVVGLELRGLMADREQPIVQKIYTEQEPVDGKGMAAVILSFNRALNRIYADFSAHLR